MIKSLKNQQIKASAALKKEADDAAKASEGVKKAFTELKAAESQLEANIAASMAQERKIESLQRGLPFTSPRVKYQEFFLF